MTDDQLTSQRFREVTLLHPTWMYHRRIWERVGGYTQDTSVGEDIVFFHKHLEANGLLLRVPRPLLRYRCHPGQRSWRLPRRAVQDAKVAAFERQVLVSEPWSQGFGVVGAGRDARDFCKALSDAARQLVTEFYEVDEKKLGKTISLPTANASMRQVPVVPQRTLRAPFVVCVALERGFGVLEAIERDAPAAVEGVDFFHLV
ncbi:B3gntl1 [Symbiodinium natans]|uniref:B3gntl1 protein n=1 Tax=Symbiodinium natans TaxID=878477 RepID=A0A812RTY8_9DINO|nr:B3gntl1 [Symbiodinium natans]